MRIVPVSGVSSPSRSRSSVVLPEPFGPISPTRSPRMIVVVSSRTIARSPREKPTSRASTTSRPDRSASCACSRTVPTRSRRALRSTRNASRARTRPSLRVRRAWIPVRIQTSSFASFLSNSAHCFASASSAASFRSR